MRYAAKPGWAASAQSWCRHGVVLFAATCLQLAPGVAGAQAVIVLSDQVPTMDISAASVMWIDTEGRTPLEKLPAGPRDGKFAPSQANAVYALGHQSVLWQRYRFARSPDSSQAWVIEFPQPLLDRVTIYQTAADGNWTSRSAGDSIAVDNWPDPGRFAQFSLRLPDSGVQDVYVRIQNVTRLSLPVRVSTQGNLGQRLQYEYLAVGIVFGALLLLIVACVVQSRVYRDRAYGWYALYATVLTLVLAAWTGVAGHLLWGRSSTWNDLAPGFLGTLAGGAALLVIHQLCGVSARYRWLEHFVRGLGFAAVPIALTYSLVARSAGVPMIGIYLACVVMTGLGKAWLTWRRGDIIGLWVLGAFTPMALATLLLVISVVGLVPSSWFSQYGLMAGLAIEVPLLLVALNLRSRERHSVEARAQALASQDALTGLLAAHIFQDRLKQVVARARRRVEPAAVVYIELVNYKYIKKNWGVAVAEQSLLRSVIKLRRILRDVDTVGRVDEARFGLILEGASSRGPVTELAARLIAAGLMPLKGLKPEVVLQFQVAAVLLLERSGSAIEIADALTDLLQHMGARSRRPIRFLEPEMTRPAPLEGHSSLPQEAAGRDEAVASV